jgi:hypothetical protein
MAEHSKKERERYNEHRKRTSEALGLDKNKYNALRRVGQSLNRADTNYANGRENYPHGKEYGEKEYKHDVNSSFAKTKALRKKMKDLHFYHQSDPRGASLYVGKKRLKQDNYNSEGHVVY